MGSGWGLFVFLSFSVLFTACTTGTEGPPPARPGVVARIGDVTIRADELRAFALSTPRSMRSRQEGAGGRQEYLRGLLAKHLILLEAQSGDLQETKEVQERLQRSWHQHLIEVYRSEEPPIQVEVAEEELRRYFEENHLGRQRQLAGILVEEKSSAREVLAKLAGGQEFEVLARQYSIHKGSAARGGIWGFISLQEAHRLKIPAEVFHQLPQGVVSDILPINERYLVMRFLQDQPGSLEAQRSDIHSVLYKVKLKEAKSEKMLSLAWEFGWKTEAAGLNLFLLKSAVHSALNRGHFSSGEADRPLFSYQGGKITVGEYVDAIGEDPGRVLSGWGIKDSAAVGEAAQATVMESAILLEAAKRAGIPQRLEERNWLEQKRWEFMVRQVRKTEVLNQVMVSEEEAREFYQAHEDIFRKSDEFDLIEVLVDTEEKAGALLAEIGKEGQTLIDLARQHTIRSGSQEEPGKVHLHGHDRYVKPQLYEAVQKAELGELTGPVQVKGGYSLFQVLHREEGELPPFSRSEKRARARVRRQKEDRLFEGLVDKLMAKYQDHITLYGAELEAALPDTLMQRLVVGGQALEGLK